MKLPRSLSSRKLIGALAPLGYQATRQTGSHIRLTTERGGQHHITIPAKKHLTIGKVNAVIWELVRHFGMARAEILETISP